MKPWLLINPQIAHNLSSVFLNCYGLLKKNKTYAWRSFEWKGLKFSNPLGIAGGMDKDGLLAPHFWKCGPGFIEVGTVTPKPQKGNLGKVIDRDNKGRALWNQMGFPSQGAEFVKTELAKLAQPHFTPLFINIGKNRTTDNEQAANDYKYLIETFQETADAFVINISSPNTPGLRDLLAPENLKKLLGEIQTANANYTPLLLKISPDITEQQLERILDISCEYNIDGWILTNSTTERLANSPFPPSGGVSGLPLSTRSKLLLQSTIKYLGDRRKDKLLVSVGGILTPNDVQERLAMGADLVQVYSALVFEGPTFFKKVAALHTS